VVHRLAQRAKRDPNEFLAEWRAKTPADCERFWATLAPTDDDDVLREVAALAPSENSRTIVGAALSDLGEGIVSTVARLAPAVMWPGVLFVAGSMNAFLSIGVVAVKWAERVPALPIAVAVPRNVWDEYASIAIESRTKALLREGQLAIPIVDAPTVEETLAKAGAKGSTTAAVIANEADAILLESAVTAVRATAAPPTTQAEDDRARSAAESFLFTFLDSLSETAGRFELNASLDFMFGARPVEVDLLCRSPRIAIEVDGYFHFLSPDSYRRDRTKDWELQRRGYVVLRFLAEDVIPQVESIRDRSLDAVTITPLGGRL
jgi:hypothetical protein